MRWYRCKCKKARTGISDVSGRDRFQVGRIVNCQDGKCVSCGQAIPDFMFYRKTKK